MKRIFIILTDLRSEILDALSVTTTSLNQVEVARAEYGLEIAKSEEVLAGGTEEERDIQKRRVETEVEQLRSLESKLLKTQVRAPFDGIVGEVFASTGEFITIGRGIARVVSEGGFELSVDVTEVEIEKY